MRQKHQREQCQWQVHRNRTLLPGASTGTYTGESETTKQHEHGRGVCAWYGTTSGAVGGGAVGGSAVGGGAVGRAARAPRRRRQARRARQRGWLSAGMMTAQRRRGAAPGL